MLLPNQLANKSKAQFIAGFVDLYEHSPWVIEQSFEQIVRDELYNQLPEFHQILSNAVLNASAELQLKLIKFHPTLAGKKAQNNQLTDFSNYEQKSAGLNNCSDTEIAIFKNLNQQYLRIFDFPFIMAIKQKTKTEILANFTARLANTKPQELDNALEQINQIAWLRIKEIYGI